MGSIYRRGKVWWIKYYQNGKPFRESTESSKKMVAAELLKRREGEISQGKIPGINFDRILFDELAEDFIRDYRINGRKSIAKAKRSVKHLEKTFKGVSVTRITTALIDKHIERRMQANCNKCKKGFYDLNTCPFCGSDMIEQGRANATINRELSALKRILNIGAEQTPPKVDRVPKIRMLKENNVRKGFFEHYEFLAMRNKLPDYLKSVITFGYKSGWREEEILSLPWDQVDRYNGCARIEPGDAKNDDARTLYFDSEIKEVIKAQWQRRRQERIFCPYVFVNLKGTDRIYRFDKAWKTACRKAGVDKLFHDLRRTAVRNMVRSGISEGVAMKISGHKTRSVFDRYNIVNDADLKNAAKAQESYIAKQENFCRGHNLGTIVDFNEKKANQ